MTPAELKALLTPLREAAFDFEPDTVRAVLRDLLAPEVRIRMCHPFGDLHGADAWMEACHLPLHAAMPDLERRDGIVTAGETPEGVRMVATMGSWMGTWTAPFLGIPATGQLAHMRYHEFYLIADGRVVEVQAIWDLPELMMQGGVWPLAPQLGRFMATPAPATGDGLNITGPGGDDSRTRVLAMLEDMCRHPGDPDPVVMRLEHHWHPQFLWYGPCGIGTARGVDGFRRHHQIPFLRAMPDRKLDAGAELSSHWIGEGLYVAETGWPNMRLTLSGDGWMGIAPSGQEVTLRSLDFWRLGKDGRIRENWVLVDLLDLHAQTGVDVLARMRELARSAHPRA